MKTETPQEVRNREIALQKAEGFAYSANQDVQHQVRDLQDLYRQAVIRIGQLMSAKLTPEQVRDLQDLYRQAVIRIGQLERQLAEQAALPLGEKP